MEHAKSHLVYTIHGFIAAFAIACVLVLAGCAQASAVLARLDPLALVVLAALAVLVEPPVAVLALNFTTSAFDETTLDSPSKEVAAVLGISEKAANKRYQRLLKKCLDILQH